MYSGLVLGLGTIDSPLHLTQWAVSVTFVCDLATIFKKDTSALDHPSQYYFVALVDKTIISFTISTIIILSSDKILFYKIKI